MPLPKIYISGQQHYACQMCGRCCRRFRVLLTRGEVERLSKLDWGDEPDVPKDFSHDINGYPYFRRRESDGGCVFLDDAGGCRMHKRFGFNEKALTCRGYPFNIVSTFKGEVSVLARMDCPGVLYDKGPDIRSQQKDITRLVSELRFGNGFTEKQLAGMSRKAVETFCLKMRAILDDESLSMSECMRFLMAFVIRAEQLGGTFMSDESTMADVYPSMMKKIREDIPEQTRYGLPGWAKYIFRQIMCAYSRRDEEFLHTGLLHRLKQSWNIARLCFGGGNLHNFGYEHPDCSVRKARMFRNQEYHSERDAWTAYRRFLSVRFECLQFFGVAYYGADIFAGAKALMLTYPLVLAFARIFAFSHGHDELTYDDVCHGIASVDHCHGRSVALNFKGSRRREAYLAANYSQLVFALGDE